MTTTGIVKRVEHHSDGRHMGKGDFVKCVDCGTVYNGFPGAFRCNGHNMLTRCPWCKPNSSPWTTGRGK